MDKWQPEQTTAATRPWSEYMCWAIMYTVPFAKSAVSFMLYLSAFRANAKVCAYTRKTKGCCFLLPVATYISSHVLSHWPDLSVSLSPFPAVYPNQDPELSYQKRALEKLAALNVKTFGKKKIFIWTSLATGCQD